MSPDQQAKVAEALRVDLIQAAMNRDMPLGPMMVAFGRAMASIAATERAHGETIDYARIWDGLRQHFLDVAADQEEQIRQALAAMGTQN